MGTSVGLWFLIASYLKLGVWDIIKSFTGCSDRDIDAHIALQIVNEAALCSNRIRRSNYMANQGFEIANGLGFLASDKQVHIFLDKHTVCQSEQMQMELAAIRKNAEHYIGNTIAFDPHRIITTSRRLMPKKKKQPEEPSKKMLQTFFAADACTGQPIGFGIGSPGVNTTKASIALFEIIEVINKSALIVADKEHFTQRLIEKIKRDTDFDLLIPATNNPRVNKIYPNCEYHPLWAGYAVAETKFNFANTKDDYRMLIQREGETKQDYTFKSFITLKSKSAKELLTEEYPKRWSIEDFFNFDGAMGFDRASTLNLNIRYAKMSLALVAQAATYEFRQQLPKPYKRWNAEHLADALLGGIDGDIKVNDDTIIVTCYNAPKEYELQKHYEKLPQKLSSQGINPHIPWLYGYKLDFRFK